MPEDCLTEIKTTYYPTHNIGRLNKKPQRHYAQQELW